MFKDLFARVVGALAVGATGLLPAGLSPASPDEALTWAVLLAIYGVTHKLMAAAAEKIASNGEE